MIALNPSWARPSCRKAITEPGALVRVPAQGRACVVAPPPRFRGWSPVFPRRRERKPGSRGRLERPARDGDTRPREARSSCWWRWPSCCTSCWPRTRRRFRSAGTDPLLLAAGASSTSSGASCWNLNPRVTNSPESVEEERRPRHARHGPLIIVLGLIFMKGSTIEETQEWMDFLQHLFPRKTGGHPTPSS
jgi:hypothetical protein